MGREKKYSPKQFDTGIKQYFKSISRMIPATEQYDTGRINSKGMPVMARREIKNEDGSPFLITEWIDKPSILKLCLFLGISKSTFNAYAKDIKYSFSATRARDTIEAYLSDQLENLKNPSGVIFNLKYNFKWSEKIEIAANIGSEIEEDALTRALREEAEKEEAEAKK